MLSVNSVVSVLYTVSTLQLHNKNGNFPTHTHTLNVAQVHKCCALVHVCLMFSSFYPPGLQKTEDRNLSNDIIVTVM